MNWVKIAVILSWVLWIMFAASVAGAYILTGEAGTDTVIGRFVQVGGWVAMFAWIPPFILSMWADTR